MKKSTLVLSTIAFAALIFVAGTHFTPDVVTIPGVGATHLLTSFKG